nr:MAG TPA: Protein of unknown function (DUF3074) [Caudoviricetes sp.]
MKRSRNRLSAKFLPLFMINSTFVKSILTQLKKLLKWAQQLTISVSVYFY